MIDLAPHHKYGISIPGPVMPAAGAFGHGEAFRDFVDLKTLGAIVTQPLSLCPRKAAKGQRIAVHGEHFVVHTGLPNPGLKRVIREQQRFWERAPVPIIAHLIATTVSETSIASVHLANTPGVQAIELGLTENVSGHKALELLKAAQKEECLPIIVRVPFSRVDELAPKFAEAGADALTLSAPPRAVLPVPGDNPATTAHYMRGRLYGPAMFPLLLNTLARWVSKLKIPIIARGGISNAEDALACLNLGASALQIDAPLWRNPTLIQDIADTLKQNAPLPQPEP